MLLIPPSRPFSNTSELHSCNIISYSFVSVEMMHFHRQTVIIRKSRSYATISSICTKQVWYIVSGTFSDPMWPNWMVTFAAYKLHYTWQVCRFPAKWTIFLPISSWHSVQHAITCDKGVQHCISEQGGFRTDELDVSREPMQEAKDGWYIFIDRCARRHSHAPSLAHTIIQKAFKSINHIRIITFNNIF